MKHQGKRRRSGFLSRVNDEFLAIAGHVVRHAHRWKVCGEQRTHRTEFNTVATALDRLAAFFQRRGFRTAGTAATAAALQHAATATPVAVTQSVIHAVLPLAEIREAHRIFEAREHFGKVVLVP